MPLKSQLIGIRACSFRVIVLQAIARNIAYEPPSKYDITAAPYYRSPLQLIPSQAAVQQALPAAPANALRAALGVLAPPSGSAPLPR